METALPAHTLGISQEPRGLRLARAVQRSPSVQRPDGRAVARGHAGDSNSTERESPRAIKRPASQLKLVKVEPKPARPKPADHKLAKTYSISSISTTDSSSTSTSSSACIRCRKYLYKACAHTVQRRRIMHKLTILDAFHILERLSVELGVENAGAEFGLRWSLVDCCEEVIKRIR
jgi:hypothetical protein